MSSEPYRHCIQRPIKDAEKHAVAFEACATLIYHLNKTIKPDPSNLVPFVKTIQNIAASLQRTFEEAVKEFEISKSDIFKVSLSAIDDIMQFRVKTNTSKFAIAATLRQTDPPIAFFSKTTLNLTVEKKKHMLLCNRCVFGDIIFGEPFEVFTDKRSVSFMFDQHHARKIKNEKIMHWKQELACYKFNIIYRPGSKNATANAFSRINAAINPEVNLKQLHDVLCYSSVVRMYPNNTWTERKTFLFHWKILEDLNL
ncbi:endonuclease [Caerostris extrusa]|uniref:Endonuclease n=1 Tax=Caerostris extrusa TaxID=172846 RepID=A0AAV4R1S2_CAEEX|nr:endonuclease [Caerostris extrusa]